MYLKFVSNVWRPVLSLTLAYDFMSIYEVFYIEQFVFYFSIIPHVRCSTLMFILTSNHLGAKPDAVPVCLCWHDSDYNLIQERHSVDDIPLPRPLDNIANYCYTLHILLCGVWWTPTSADAYPPIQTVPYLNETLNPTLTL